MHEIPALKPLDVHNRKLRDEVHPEDWKNPHPSGKYNLVVVGAGTAGLVTAAGAAGLGAKVALIERELMGGDCLNVGCVPSKAIIAGAKAVHAARNGNELGVRSTNVEFDFERLMERLRRVRSEIAHHDSASRFRNLGVDVFLGQGNFVKDGVVEVGGAQLNYHSAVIATGASARPLPIEGLEDVEYLTNESLFSLTELPESMIVIGGGPIGCEMAQSFARFGTQVALVEKSDRILSREDPDAACVVQKSLAKDGVNLELNAKTLSVDQEGSKKRLRLEQNGEQKLLTADCLLLGVGRSPNVDRLGLENVGVEFDLREGVKVDDQLRTTGKRIFAAGDVCSRYKFTHAADFMARIVIQNALFFGRKKLSSLTIPWSTYTSPELAQVGLTAVEARQRGLEIDTYTQEFSGVDRAILEGDTEGFARIHTRKGTGQILGGTVVGEAGGEMISEITLAMTNNLSLGNLASTIHPYPTRTDALRKLGDQYNRTRLTPFVKSVFERLLAWRRR